MSNPVAQVIEFHAEIESCAWCGTGGKEGFTAAIAGSAFQLQNAVLCLKCFTNAVRIAAGVQQNSSRGGTP